MATICPVLLSRGFCLNNLCQYIHDTSNFCASCRIAFTLASEYNLHAQTANHIQHEASSRWLHCKPCNRYYKHRSPEQTSHETSRAHIVKTAQSTSTGNPLIEEQAPPNTTRCEACNVVVQSSAYSQHCHTRQHATRLLVVNYLNAVALTEQNQNGVEVSGDKQGIDLGIWNPAQSAPEVVWISYTGQNVVSLLEARTLSALGMLSGRQLCFTISTIALPVAIEQGSSVAVQIRFNPYTQRGRFEDRLELVFRDSNNNIFVITRSVRATVGNIDLTVLAPIAAYIPLRRARQKNAKLRVIKGGERSSLPTGYERRLEHGNIPANIKQLLSHGSLEQQLSSFRDQFMPEDFRADSYKQYWSSLVYAEHVQAEIDLSKFDMDDVKLTKRGRLYELEVPGLAEKRPSVLKGDRINIHPHDQEDGVWFNGIVHNIVLSAVQISFHPSFPHRPSALYDVEFILNPTTFQRMLQAVSTNHPRTDIIFPTTENTYPANTPEANANPEVAVYNHILDTNEEQLQAVEHVVKLPSGSPPFVIFGPPGTGKTMTIVECIGQLLDRPSVRVLACAPSNSASDLIAQRLIDTRGLGASELFRLNAIWRPRSELPEQLFEYSLYSDQHNHFVAPGQEKLRSYRIVVATCLSAALLYARNIEPGHFTHIFVDEAGQASEPEVMIPVLLQAGVNANVILSGDPKQLGPVIRSPVARQLGMSTSYLERLMSLPAYDEVTMRGASIAKLLKNFRSHEAILSFPNEQFYMNELIACASPNVTDTFLSWIRLASPKFPIIFEAIAGEGRYAGGNLTVVLQPSRGFLSERICAGAHTHSTTRQIGIVTPYRAQVRKIKQLLREINIQDIDVGSVENFQGQERQVVILSTVRSNQDFLSFDLKHTLGFVANKRRLNVAITRAQALLIIVGDPAVLGLDSLWRRFLYFIYHSGGWKGSAFPWDPEANPDEPGETTSSLAEQEIIQLLRRAGADGTDGTDEDVAGVGDT